MHRWTSLFAYLAGSRERVRFVHGARMLAEPIPIWRDAHSTFCKPYDDDDFISSFNERD